MARLFAFAPQYFARETNRVLFGLLCVLSILVLAPTYAQKPNQPEPKKTNVKADVKTEWSKLSGDQQSALAPVQKEWSSMSGAQQKRLVNAAKDYPKLQPIQKERFQTRLRDWAALTPEQRKAARTKYETLSKLPPAKQFEIHEKWQDKQAAKSAPSTVVTPQTVPAGALR